MGAPKKVYVCHACGGQSAKWVGQCPGCGEWNTLSETSIASTSRSGGSLTGRDLSGALSTIRSADEVSVESQRRYVCGLNELDRVLGGGVVPGSVILIGGDPGIGKSTLLLQTIIALGRRAQAGCLYVTGEESLGQVIARARRLELPTDDLRLLAETQVERIISLAQAEQPRVLVIDSIQTMHTDLLESAPGGVAQVRESAAQLVRYAKSNDTCLFLVGHVTKEGSLAGPRVLEHMVDTVLYFESEAGSRFRVIRAIKNRFGAANEIGLFAMTEKGLREVSNPSAIFFSRREVDVPGSTIMVTREGTRPLLVEVQALVDESQLVAPRRVTVGFDTNRLAMLLAVLNRHGGVSTHGQDVFLNVVGGVRVAETAADLPVLLSVLSSFRNRLFSSDTVVFGEIGLGGEVRPVAHGEERIKEAAKHGFTRAIVPRANVPKVPPSSMQIRAVETLVDAIQ